MESGPDRYARRSRPYALFSDLYIPKKGGVSSQNKKIKRTVPFILSYCIEATAFSLTIEKSIE
jgi:hypothetical protein